MTVLKSELSELSEIWEFGEFFNNNLLSVSSWLKGSNYSLFMGASPWQSFQSGQDALVIFPLRQKGKEKRSNNANGLRPKIVHSSYDSCARARICPCFIPFALFTCWAYFNLSVSQPPSQDLEACLYLKKLVKMIQSWSKSDRSLITMTYPDNFHNVFVKLHSFLFTGLPPSLNRSPALDIPNCSPPLNYQSTKFY